MVIGLAAGALVSIGLDFFLETVPPLGGMTWIILALIIAIALGVFFVLKRTSVAKGQPLEDERSKKIKALAGYYGYIASMYYVLGLMFFGGTDNSSLLSRRVLIISMLGMAFFFVAFWVYLSQQADVELPE
jgi:hypothetical protein